MECKHCHRRLQMCTNCDGGRTSGGLYGHCSVCDNTGYVCPEHGKYWN